jgi:hypothetical protein
MNDKSCQTHKIHLLHSAKVAFRHPLAQRRNLRVSHATTNYVNFQAIHIEAFFPQNKLRRGVHFDDSMEFQLKQMAETLATSL